MVTGPLAQTCDSGVFRAISSSRNSIDSEGPFWDSVASLVVMLETGVGPQLRRDFPNDLRG